jgi:hypothetical protein
LTPTAREVTAPFDRKRWFEVEVTSEEREKDTTRVVDLGCGGGVGAAAEGECGLERC